MLIDDPIPALRPAGRLERSRPAPFSAIVLGLLSLLGLPALASDGAIEISPAAIAAGGITPGDGPGFPATLSTPGRYVLTGTLEVPDSATTAIEITAADVALDLNGFSISGPSLCGGDPVSCSPAGLGVGVSASGSRVSVSNGSIFGVGDAGLSLGTAARVDRMVVSLNAGTGIATGPGSEIRESRVDRNGGAGIAAGEGSLVIDSVVRGNLGVGLELGDAAGYANNVLSANSSPEITGGTELGANACPAVGGCPPGQIDCGGLCVSPDTDEENCGGCGFSCSAGELCSGGSCALSCQASLTNCSGLCTNTFTDETHCGGCGISCTTNETCSGGQCACGMDLGGCSGSAPSCCPASGCTDLATDESNCGVCGFSCGPGQVCSAGSCV